MRRVYQFGLRAPTVNADIVYAQLRAAHDYRNDLVAIERGRRYALRLVDDTPEVRSAVEALSGVRKRKERAPLVSALRLARKTARVAASEECMRIDTLDNEIRRSARAATPCYWGSYLDIEARHQQSRAQPLYGDDAVTPNDPRFVRWRGHEGQIGVQLQGGLATHEAYTGSDSRVRVERGPTPNRRLVASATLSIRVGSDGRAPIWASFPLIMHREIPSSAVWKWVRVSCRREGLRTTWTCEITVDDSAPAARSLDRDLNGAIAVEWEWSKLDDGTIRVARWASTRGESGEVLHNAEGIRKPDGIRAVRYILLNAMRSALQRALQSAGALPRWLAETVAVVHMWKSPARFYELRARWLRERYDGARSAFDLLDAWWARDQHLYDYEVGARGQALRRRRDAYRVLAAAWARGYRYVLISDQDLSREARFGDDSDVRFTAGCSVLAGCLRNTFGDDAVASAWRDSPSENDSRSWCERTRDAWMAGGARGDGRFAESKVKTANAWAARKRRKAARQTQTPVAREAADSGTE